jgi:hypothetical protein
LTRDSYAYPSALLRSRSQRLALRLRAATPDTIDRCARVAAGSSTGGRIPGRCLRYLQDGLQARTREVKLRAARGAFRRRQRAQHGRDGEAARGGHRQGNPARHDAQDHRNRAGGEVQRVDLRGSGSWARGPRARRRSHQVLDDQSQRRAGPRRAGYGGADDALDGLPFGDGLAAGQLSLGGARTDDQLRVHGELSRCLHVSLRHADGARAHRVRHVRHDDRRAAQWLSNESGSRIRGGAE